MTKTTIGIDVSKHKLDVATFPDKQSQTFANDTAGHQALIKWMRPHQASHIVFEATGRYHQKLARALSRADIAFGLLNPRRSKRFIDATGALAKTDRTDALHLAHFAAVMEPDQPRYKSQEIEILQEYMAARRALMRDRTAIINRLHTQEAPLLKRQGKARLKQINGQIDVIDQACKALIQADSDLKAKWDILCSIPGIGPLTACILIADMPELGSMDKKQAAALAGLAPMTQQSGLWSGKARIRGGRRKLRNDLYMPTLSATRYNHAIREKYLHLINRGKPPKVAITAAMRKLIIMANALIRENRKWVN